MRGQRNLVTRYVFDMFALQYKLFYRALIYVLVVKHSYLSYDGMNKWVIQKYVVEERTEVGICLGNKHLMKQTMDVHGVEA